MAPLSARAPRISWRPFPDSHTGQALNRYREGLATDPATAPGLTAGATAESPPAYQASEILIRHAREHNLRNIDLTIPRDAFTVITGVSGSGKSTVAFDILFAEGQRRYLETLNAYARQFVQPAPRPDVDGIFGVPPTVAIEQRTSRGGRKSTVATVTEIYHFLRLLFVRLGTQYCPDCGIAIEPQSPEAILATLMKEFRGLPGGAARAAGGGPQGLLHRSRQVGRRQGFFRAQGGWRADPDRQMAAPRSLPGA